MTQVQCSQATNDRLVMILASLAGGWALAASLAPWRWGHLLATLGPDYRSMSRAAAASILALGAALVLGRLRSRWAHGLARALAGATALTCAGILAGNALGWQPGVPLDLSGLHEVVRFRMSPLASWSLLVLSLAVGLGGSGAGPARLRQWGAAAALGPLAVGLVALVTYAAGAPLLYGTRTIPMTLPTAILSTLLATLVPVAAGPDTWPRSLFARGGPEAGLLAPRRGPVLVFLALALAILAGGTVVLRSYLRAAQAMVQDELAAIAGIKAGQVSDWYAMWQGDVLQVVESRLIQDRFRHYLEGPDTAAARRDLEEWMEWFRKGEGYARVVLFDGRGRPRLAVPAPAPVAVPPDLGRRVAAALARGRSRPLALQEDLGAGRADFSLWAPVAGGPDGAGSGALMFQVEAQPFLARILGPWPQALPSTEVLLVGRERGEAVVIGGARRPGEPVWIRRAPLAGRTGLPAALALQDRDGPVAGTDLRGRRVVGHLKRVAGTPWSLVSKVDEVEAAGPMRRRAWTGGLALLGLVALAAAGTGLMVRHQDAGRILVQLAAERDRKALAERSEHLMRMAHDIILLTDLEGRILETNLAASEHFGYTEAEFRGLALRDLRRPEYAAELQERFEAVKRAGVARFESIYLRKDGTEFPAEISIRVIELGGAVYVLHFARDITERHRAAEERRQMEARLAQTQRLESLGSLAGGVAHDMNNVLGAILSLASAHREGLPAGSPMARSLDTITTACLRGRGVVRSLLRFARKDLDETRVLDLNQLVRDVVQLLGFTTLKRIGLEMELAEPLAPVEGDGGALSHALMNLAVNALDAMPGQGTLRLRTANLPGGRVRVTVQDTGQGMPPEVLARALEPFFTTKPAGKGTGLGLAMVFGTVQAHGGDLELASRPGEGTTVTLTFPAREPVPAAPEPAPDPGPGEARDGWRILVVDDDELIRDSLVPMLRILGHSAQAAPGGLEALAMLDGGLDPDLVILDMNMPGLDGAGTLVRIRARRPRQRVLLASGYSDSDLGDLVQGQPGVDSIQKPFSMAELRARLERFRSGPAGPPGPAGPAGTAAGSPGGDGPAG